MNFEKNIKQQWMTDFNYKIKEYKGEYYKV